MSANLAETLLHLIGRRDNDFDALAFAQELAERAVALLDGVAGVFLAYPATAPMVVAGSAEAKPLMRLQLDRGQGPGIESFHSGSSVLAPDLAEHRTRWPDFDSARAERGFRAAHAFPIKVEETTIGALCLFRSREEDRDEDVLRLGRKLVCAAGIRLLHQAELQRLEKRTMQLQNALDSRVVIEQAKGIVAERYHLSLESAFEALRRHARQHNLRLNDVCRRVIVTTERSRSGADAVRPRDI